MTTCSQKTQLMLSCTDNQYCVCFDEKEEGDGYIWVQCSYKPWLYEVCAINIILDSSEQPQHAQLATQKPHNYALRRAKFSLNAHYIKCYDLSICIQ